MSHNADAHDGTHSHTVVPIQVYIYNAIALTILMALTVGAAFIDLGSLNPVVAVTIAVFKAVLIVLFFMNVKYSSRLTWVFVGAAFFWLFLMLGLFLPDYLVRDFDKHPDEWISSPYELSVAPIDRRIVEGEGHGHESPADH